MQPVRPPPPTHNFPREGAHEGGGALALRPFSPPRGALFVHKFFRNEKFQFPPSSVTVFVTPRKNGREGACEARKGSTRRTKKNPYTHIFYQYIFPGASVRLYFFGPFFRSAFYPHIDIEGARCDMTCRGRETPHADRDYVTRRQTWPNFLPSQTGASDLNLKARHLWNKSADAGRRPSSKRAPKCRQPPLPSRTYAYMQAPRNALWPPPLSLCTRSRAWE